MSNQFAWSRTRFSSPLSADYYRAAIVGTETENTQTFSGVDAYVYINGIRVSNLDSITWSISTDTMPNYGMGDADVKSITRGKRIIVGSMTMTQWDRDALIEQVFRLSYIRNEQNLTQGDLFANNSVGRLFNNTSSTFSVSAGSVGGAGTQTIGIADYTVSDAVSLFNTSAARGLSRAEFEIRLAQQAREAAKEAASKFILYPDQLPAFDMTLVCINKNGFGKYAAIQGINITQVTDGMSMSDMNSMVGYSFMAMRCTHWKELRVGRNPI